MANFSLHRVSAPVFIVLALALASCSSDNSPIDGGKTDKTPPAVTSITPIDAGHIDVKFNEDLKRTTAEHSQNYIIVETTTRSSFASGASSASPGDTLWVSAASLNADQRTVSLSTQIMGALPYDLSVTGVTDLNNNSIINPVTTSFTGTSAPDVTAPEIVYRSPAPNATGVGVGATVLIQFSEQVTNTSFVNGLSFTSSGGPVSYEAGSYDVGVHVIVTPTNSLDTGTLYTLSLTGVEDYSGNVMPDVSWSFRTTPYEDTTPPTVVSSSPANLATNVSINTNLSLTFSEAINQALFQPQISPEPGSGVVTWSNGGKTVTFDPDLPLEDNQQYSVTMLPDAFRDLAGNGNVEIVNIRFTTANALATGGILGTLTGDPTSTGAQDPTGAFVAAATSSPFTSSNFSIGGTAIVAGNDTYNVRYLADDVYYPIAVLDSNGDGKIDPSTGDAVGAYGVDFGVGDMSPDSVTISNGDRHVGIDFDLFDPSAILGTVSYSGSLASGFYTVGVGLFDTTAFNPSAEPTYGRNLFWPGDIEWSFGTLDDGLADGTYFVGAYLDANSNSTYDPGVDPAGFYGGAVPTPIHVENGSDALGIVIPMLDPLTASRSASVVWRVDKSRAPWFRMFSAAVVKSWSKQKK